MEEQNNAHPSHPVRNFFYVLWSLVNAFCFIGLFYALYDPHIPLRPVFVLATATVLVFALIFGFFRPLFRR